MLGARIHAQAHPLQVSAGELAKGKNKQVELVGSGHCRIETKGKS